MTALGMREPFPGFPPPLTNRPDGLLSLLGIQNSGRYPQHLAVEALIPVLDLTRWYLESEQDFPTVTTVTGGALGFHNMITVPEGETWVVLGGSLDYNGALAVARWDSIVRANSTGTAGWMQLSQPTRGVVGERPLVSVDASGAGQLLRPLTQLGLWAGVAAAAVNVTLTMRVARLLRA
jgi:hypothetical protein